MTSREAIGGGVDPLDIEAVDWVVRLTVGSLSDADREAFDRWRSASADHERAFAAASDLCGHLRRIPLPIGPDSFADTAEAAAPSNDNGMAPFGRGHAPRMSRRAFMGGGGVIAASFAGGLAMVNPPLGLWPSLAELMADERTAAGERRSFSPVAGVDVELNSRSSASRIDGGHGLALIGGDAYVSVAPRERPFAVTAGAAHVATTDGAFNIEMLDSDLCVTCARGSLRLARAGAAYTLDAGEEVAFAADGAAQRRAADMRVRLAWRQGLLILRQVPVAEAIPQINRYFPGRVVLTDSAKSDWPVSGVFHVDQIEVAVVQLQRLLNVGVRRLPGGVVLLG